MSDSVHFGVATTKRDGVIAVLFLVVIAFIFGAISLSMQTGQIIERRIATDQSADMSAFAFASKSAQGLNFISANNLAIAGASHMAGAFQLLADWLTMYSVLWTARPICDFCGSGGGIFSAAQYQTFYDWFRPISRFYIKSAVGLTSINDIIKSVYPYLGMIDALRIGDANTPGALVMPFRAPTSASATTATGTTSFASKIEDAVKNAAKTLVPRYQGLAKINSDEAFCLSFAAAQDAGIGPDLHNPAAWIQSGIASVPVIGPALGEVAGIFKTIQGTIGFLASLLHFQIGFTGCGFGRAGPMQGGSGDLKKDLNALENTLEPVLAAILKGPISGRSVTLSTPTAASTDTTTTIKPFYLGLSQSPSNPTLNDEAALALDLDANFPSCKDTNAGSWQIKTGFQQGGAQLTAFPEYGSGVCLKPASNPPKYGKYSRDLLSTPQVVKTNLSPSPPASTDSRVIYLMDYQVVCFGEYLFKWEGFAGLATPPMTAAQITAARANPHLQIPPTPASASYPGISNTATAPFCPGFQATPPSNGQPPLFYPTPSALGQIPPNFTDDLDRAANFFLSPLITALVGDASSVPDQNNPRAHAAFAAINNESKFINTPPLRVDAVEQVNKMMACANNKAACPYSDALGGYFQNDPKASDAPHPEVPAAKFHPNLQSLNWLCPVAGDNAQTEELLSRVWKFTHLEVADIAGKWHGNFRKIQDWHNSRIDELLRLNATGYHLCDEWRLYAQNPDAAPAPPQQAGQQPTNSNDYCGGNYYYCWQRAMQTDTKQNEEASQTELAKGKLSFLVPNTTDTFHNSLHYAVVTVNPLRTDQPGDIAGRNDGTALASCPPNLEITPKLAKGAAEPICDVQPVIGLISRALTGSTSSPLNATTNLGVAGAGDMNLASGGAMSLANGLLFGVTAFTAIAQARVDFDDNPPDQPSKPPQSGTPPKNYQMFWPSWRPKIEPSRVMSHLVGPLAPLVED